MPFNFQETFISFKKKKKKRQKESWIRVLLLLRCYPTARGRSTAGSSAGAYSAPWPRVPGRTQSLGCAPERGEPGHPTLHA